MPAIKFVCGMFWGLMADKFRCRKVVNLVTSACSTLTICLLAIP